MALGSSTISSFMLCLSSLTDTHECCGPTITGLGDSARATLFFTSSSFCLPSASTVKRLCLDHQAVSFRQNIALPIAFSHPHLSNQAHRKYLEAVRQGTRYPLTSNQKPCYLQAARCMLRWGSKSRHGLRGGSGATVFIFLDRARGKMVWDDTLFSFTMQSRRNSTASDFLPPCIAMSQIVRTWSTSLKGTGRNPQTSERENERIQLFKRKL